MRYETGSDHRRYVAVGRFAGRSLRGGTTFEVPLIELGVTDRLAPDRVAVDLRRGPFEVNLQVRSGAEVYRFHVEDGVAELLENEHTQTNARTRRWLRAVLRYVDYEEEQRCN